MIEVAYIDHMGSDDRVADAARVSHHKEAAGFAPGQNARLLAYLASHNHWSPFAHCSATFRVKAPIFVARQLQKHQVGFAWNEVSRRYVDEEPEFYEPSVWRRRAPNVKQGSLSEAVALPRKVGECIQCGADLAYSGPPETRAAHVANKRFCDGNCQMSHWRATNPRRRKFTAWKATARQDGALFTITEADLDWPELCPYLGAPLVYEANDRGPYTASLDKIRPELGYVPGNVQIISLRANKMKSDAVPEEIVAFARNAALMHGGVFIEPATSYRDLCQKLADTYRRLIKAGVAPEQARCVLPLSTMTEWFWSGSLAAWARMCHLRLAPDAQGETRLVANEIARLMADRFPVSWAALSGWRPSQSDTGDAA